MKRYYTVCVEYTNASGAFVETCYLEANSRRSALAQAQIEFKQRAPRAQVVRVYAPPQCAEAGDY